MEKQLELTFSAFDAATFAWGVYYLFHFLGFEYAADIMLIPVFLWTVVAFGSLPLIGMIWCIRHVRIRIEII